MLFAPAFERLPGRVFSNFIFLAILSAKRDHGPNIVEPPRRRCIHSLQRKIFYEQPASVAEQSPCVPYGRAKRMNVMQRATKAGLTCDSFARPEACHDESTPTLPRLWSTTPTSPIPHSCPSARGAHGGRGRQGPENRRVLAPLSPLRTCISGRELGDRSRRRT